MSDRRDIPFPVDLASIADAPTLATLRTIEIGAIVRLALIAWQQDPPGTLPDDDGMLAAWSGLEAAAWSEARPAILRVFKPGGDGRLRSEALEASHDRLATKAAKRSRAGRQAAIARHYGGGGGGGGSGGAPPPLRFTTGPHANRMRNGCETHPGAESPPAPPSSKRSALQRSTGTDLNPSAPRGAPSAPNQPAGEILGDVAALRRIRERREVESILRAAQFPWAPEGSRTLPPNVVAELAGSKHSSPMRALFAVQTVQDRGRAGKCENPIGMMIAIFGARRSGSRPWDIPELFVSQVWERREADRSRLNAVQERIDAIRASKPDNGPATGTRH